MNKPVVLVAALVAAVAGSAQAEIKVYTFGLDGLQEVPAVVTPAFGSATVTLDTISGAVSVAGEYHDLIGTVTASHIHGLAAVGSNAGVIVTLSPSGGSSGTITGNGVLNPTQIQGMLDGLCYVNVHSTFKPGGEIRGQIVPAPASLALGGLLGLAGARRRR